MVHHSLPRGTFRVTPVARGQPGAAAQGLDANRVDLVVEKKMDTTAKAIYGADRVAFSPVAAASPQTT